MFRKVYESKLRMNTDIFYNDILKHTSIIPQFRNRKEFDERCTSEDLQTEGKRRPELSEPTQCQEI